jgi:hypothetical protein
VYEALKNYEEVEGFGAGEAAAGATGAEVEGVAAAVLEPVAAGLLVAEALEASPALAESLPLASFDDEAPLAAAALALPPLLRKSVTYQPDPLS